MMAQPEAHPLRAGNLTRVDRRDDIQGLRAVAVLSVTAFHASDVVPGGFVGVDMFFVISGYVITLMLERERERYGRIRLGRFYVRRFKRLTPALALVAVVTVAASALLMSPFGAQQNTALTAVAAVFALANVAIALTTGDYFDAAAETNPLLHTWSLSVEEQFYFLFPMLLIIGWFVGRRLGRRSAPVAVIALVGAVSLGLTLATASGLKVPGLPDVLVGFYGPATRVWEFAAGALLALAGQRLAPRSSGSAILLAVLGTLGIVGSFALIDSQTVFPGPWTLLPVAATALLLVAGMRENRVSRGLSSRPMVTIGDLSYSLYLWHWPFIVFASLLWQDSLVAPVIAAILSAVPAWLSYRLVEQPLRRMDVDRKRLVLLGTTTLLPPLIIGALVTYVSNHDYWSDDVRRYRTAITTPHLSSTNPAGCTSRAWEKFEECTWNGDLGGDPIYLVGDSNAVHFSDAVVEAGRQLGRPVTIAGQIGCSFVDVELSHPERAIEDLCNDYATETLTTIVAARPGTVIVSNSYLWWYESTGIAVGLPGETPTDDPSERLVVLERGLRSSIEQLQGAGHKVIVVQPVPHWGDNANDMTWADCSVAKITAGSCAKSIPLTDAAARQGSIWSAVETAGQITGDAAVDFSHEICPQGICFSETLGVRVRYQDGTHITVAQSQSLTQSFKNTLE